MTDAVRRLHEATDKVIQTRIGKFLAESGDSEGNRQRRYKAVNNDEAEFGENDVHSDVE